MRLSWWNGTGAQSAAGGMHPEEERNLVARCRAGDYRAFDALFRAHQGRAYGVALRLTGSHHDADDVLQDAWLRALRGISRFNGRARFLTWFWRIVVRAAADHERRSRRHRRAGDTDMAEDLPAQPQSSCPVEQVAARELQRAIENAMRDLPAPQRAALVLVTFDGLSYAEASRAASRSA